MPAFRRVLGLAALASVLLAWSVAPIAAHEEYRWVGTIEKLDTKTGKLTVTWMENGKKQIGESTVTIATSVTRNGVGVAKSELRIGLSVVVIAEENIYVPSHRIEATDVMLVPALRR